MLLEICANSFESALNAQQAGAHRIELCSELAIGGITPSYGLLKRVMEHIQIPVHVLIRPRGGDFTYSANEFAIMKENIQLCKELGCAGIVSGILTTNQQIDISRTIDLIELARPLSFTFHRAFDWVSNPQEAVLSLINLGVDRVLTSGQAHSAEQGIDLLKVLRELAKDQLIILPGGGINKNNASMFKASGFPEIHCSATRLQQTIPPPKISMNSSKFFQETHIALSAITTIKQILDKITNDA